MLERVRKKGDSVKSEFIGGLVMNELRKTDKVAELFTQGYADLGIPTWLLGVAIVWSLVWKGLALWKSARKSQSIWFVILLVVNTLGILEILYIFLFSKIGYSKKPAGKPVKGATINQITPKINRVKKPARKTKKK